MYVYIFLSFYKPTFFQYIFFLNNYLLQQFPSYFCRNTNNETKDGINSTSPETFIQTF